MLAAVLVAVVSAYLAYDPYRTEEDEVFELNLKALSDGDEGEDGEGGEGGGEVIVRECYDKFDLYASFRWIPLSYFRFCGTCEFKYGYSPRRKTTCFEPSECVLWKESG